MPDNPKQPKEYDVVMNGQTAVPAGAVVLGGLEGVKNRLASPVVKVQVAALSEAMKYGEAGLKLVIHAVRNSSKPVQQAAENLLLLQTRQPKFKPTFSFHSTFLVMRTESGDCYFPLIGRSCWTIGRRQDNNIVLSDRCISRNHAMLKCIETGDFYLMDLGSCNGSFLNGERVTMPLILQNGDRIKFGETELEFYCLPTHRRWNFPRGKTVSYGRTYTELEHVLVQES